MNFQTNYYYDLPREVQWEIQSFVQVDKPKRHADAASIIKAKKELVHNHFFIIKVLNLLDKNTSKEVLMRWGSKILSPKERQDVDRLCLVCKEIISNTEEIILYAIINPISLMTMHALNARVRYWIEKHGSKVVEKDYDWNTHKQLGEVLCMELSSNRLTFNKGTQVSAVGQGLSFA